MEACNAVEREVDKVLSKFSTISEHADRVLRYITNCIEALKKEYDDGPSDHELTATQILILKQSLNKVRSTVQKLTTDHRDLHSTVSKVGKAIDRPKGIQESKSLPSKALQESKSLQSQGLQESKSLPSKDLQESKSLPFQGLQESKSLPSQGLQESKSLPSQGLQESKSLPSQGLQESKSLPSQGLQESKSLPSQGLQETKILPSKDLQEIKILPSKDPQEIKILPSNDLQEIKSLPSQGIQESKSLPSKDLKESKSLPSQGLQESKSLPSQGLQESKSLPSQGLQESKSLPSQGLQESKSLPSQGLQESKSLPSQGNQKSKRLPSKGLQESKSLTSKDLQESKSLSSQGRQSNILPSQGRQENDNPDSPDSNFVSDFASTSREDVFSTPEQEAGLKVEDEGKEPFSELNQILDCLKLRDLGPALQWACAHRESLEAQNSSLEFKLHRLQFIDHIQRGPAGQGEAINYARTHFQQFVNRHEKEEGTILAMEKLMLIKEGPMLLEKGPMIIEEGTTLIEKGPMLVEEGNMLTEEGTTLVEKGPMIAEEGTMLVEKGPMIAEEGTMLVEKGPMIAEEGTMLVEKGPMIAEEGTMLVEKGPMIAEGDNASRGKNYSIRKLQSLMGMFLYLPHGISSSPYSHLLDPNMWVEIYDVFTRDACSLLGLSVDSPLSVCVNAGCTALPALLNIKQVMLQRQVTGIWNGKDELPIEIDLGQDSRYHSVFACPILRQQSTENNPPMRLICGHVISRDALNKLSNGNKLKCPYCPIEQSPSDARLIYF
uniref:RMD5-like protein n=2 Tax=Timema TaxID=61471 RepID=A0A7R9E4L7_9NEOP|nr:unnamed protein product [Timema monikensis]